MLKNFFVGRVMCTLTVLMLSQTLLSQAQAQDISIFEVRKNIPLAEDEKSFRDYYLNAGSSQGLKKGMTVTIVRKVTVKEASQDRPAVVIHVPIGSLNLIHVEDGVSVGRLSQIFSREDLPMVEHQALMIGDQVDLKLSEKDFKSVQPRETPSEVQAVAQNG